MITGWLSPEDCPDCGGFLLDMSNGPELLILACPGCGYHVTWHATDPDLDPGHDTEPGALEAE